MLPRKLTLVRVESLSSGEVADATPKPEAVEALEEFLDGAAGPASRGEQAMTLEQFVNKFKALLREGERFGINTEDMCQTAEHIIENGWHEEPEGLDEGEDIEGHQ